MPKTTNLIALLVAASAATTAVADQGRWYINPAIGYQDFDSKRDLDESTTLSIGGEYRYGDNWAAKLRYLDTDADASSGGADVDVNQYYLDALYYLQPETERLQPFALFGLGHAEFDSSGGDASETQANVGAGIRYLLSDNWSLRGDVRAIFGTDDDTWDSLINVGISYAFGGKKAAATRADGDSDGDGVADSRDNCPATAAGASVDANGCALATDGDGDNDGVLDSKDQCLTTPAGKKVDSNGCKLVLTRDVEMTLEINFANDSAEIDNDGLAEIDRVASFLNRYEAVDVNIGGHTDDRGAPAYNKSLSQRRADTVRLLLIEKHNIAASRVTATGYGEEQPIASNDDAAGRLANRRVVATMKAQVEEE